MEPLGGSPQISGNVLEACGVKPLRFLGGRSSLVWLVQRGEEELTLRQWQDDCLESIEFEIELMRQVEAEGWPVAVPSDPIEAEGRLYSLAKLLTGEPFARNPEQQRLSGRWMAEFQQMAANLVMTRQRPGWRRRCHETLWTARADELLAAHQVVEPEVTAIVAWHLDRARTRMEEVCPMGDLELLERVSPVIPIHGDFAPWNLLVTDSRLTGLLDFELSRLDNRIAEFFLSWRGLYDEVLEGYWEVNHLEEAERALIVPCWWAFLIDQCLAEVESGRTISEWNISKLLARSPSMERDAQPCPLARP